MNTLATPKDNSLQLDQSARPTQTHAAAYAASYVGGFIDPVALKRLLYYSPSYQIIQFGHTPVCVLKYANRSGSFNEMQVHVPKLYRPYTIPITYVGIYIIDTQWTVPGDARASSGKGPSTYDSKDGLFREVVDDLMPWEEAI